MKDWERRLEHSLDIQDALVACRNERPVSPPGSIGITNVTSFAGEICWKHLAETGHTNGDYAYCNCRLEKQ